MRCVFSAVGTTTESEGISGEPLEGEHVETVVGPFVVAQARQEAGGGGWFFPSDHEVFAKIMYGVQRRPGT